MPIKLDSRLPAGVWSASPTPFTSRLKLDTPSILRLVEHHAAMGISGLLLAGTCGEGPWLRSDERATLAKSAVEASAGRLRMALQVTDNSVRRVLRNIEDAVDAGADVAMVAAPHAFINPTPKRLRAHYLEIVRKSALPVGFYDQSAGQPHILPDECLPELLAEPNLHLIKDSSASPARRAIYLAARKRRPDLRLLNGDEFDCVSYLQAGYDGLMLGGGIFNGRLAIRILQAVRGREAGRAQKLQSRMNDLMHRVYGGPECICWLTGLKELLVQMGIFTSRANLLGCPLTSKCRSEILGAVTGADGFGYDQDLFGRRARSADRNGEKSRSQREKGAQGWSSASAGRS